MSEVAEARRPLRADVSLVPIEPAHAENMYRWMCDPEVSDNIGLRSAPSIEKTMRLDPIQLVSNVVEWLLCTR